MSRRVAKAVILAMGMAAAPGVGLAQEGHVAVHHARLEGELIN